MRVVVATGRGRVAADLPSPDDGAQLLVELADVSCREVAGLGLPTVYRTARYRRETTRPEVWQSAAVTARRGYGDCEDLAAYRVGELWATGLDPAARPAMLQRAPGLWHAVVMRGNGMIEDPSASLGMRTDGLQLAQRRDPRGVYYARILVPCGTDATAKAYGMGGSPLEAVAEATAELSAGLVNSEIPIRPEAAEVGASPSLSLQAATDLELLTDAVNLAASGRWGELSALLDAASREGVSGSVTRGIVAAVEGCVL